MSETETLTQSRTGAETEDGRAEEALAPYHPTWSTNPVASWLVEHGGHGTDLGRFLKKLCEHLLDEDVPLFRVRMGNRAMHPEVYGRDVIWQRGQVGIVEIDREHGIDATSLYRNSPVRLIHEDAGALRRRLDGPHVQRDFPVLDDLIRMGCTDYVIMPILHSNGQINYISWTTDQPGGFSTPQLTLLYDLLPLISLRVEIENAYEATRTLLTTYLGREPARRVLAGKTRRAQVESIRAAIWFSDLRGFTRMSDRTPPDQVVALLDDFFETLARPIEAHGGEVLKFLGDGLLAIFNGEADAGLDCAHALAAAKDALAGLEPENARRAVAGEAPINCGIGLHLGEVQFGNIGARDRLDFTVIGPAVNEASRVEALCKVLDRPLLASARFAEAIGPTGLTSLGFHVLRGVSTPEEIFGPAERTHGG